MGIEQLTLPAVKYEEVSFKLQITEQQILCTKFKGFQWFVFMNWE